MNRTDRPVAWRLAILLFLLVVAAEGYAQPAPFVEPDDGTQALGELPEVVIPGPCEPGVGDEGTAMLEIIHDMAPGAALMFCATGSGVMRHVDALLALAAAGANIIAQDGSGSV